MPVADSNRFHHLESSAVLPEKLKSAIARMNRFESLEIAKTQSHVHRAPAKEKLLCPHCGQTNESERDLCWACCKPFVPKETAKPLPDQPMSIILEGMTYESSDPNLPRDIRDL